MNIKLAVSLFALVCVSACGKEGGSTSSNSSRSKNSVKTISTPLNSSGKAIGSCVVNHATGRYCSEFSQSVSATLVGKKIAENTCVKDNSKLEEKGCEIDSVIGYCYGTNYLSESGEFVRLEQVMVIYSSSLTESALELQCMMISSGFQYSKTAPVK